jgi:hypothetical protein
VISHHSGLSDATDTRVDNVTVTVTNPFSVSGRRNTSEFVVRPGHRGNDLARIDPAPLGEELEQLSLSLGQLHKEEIAA